MYLFTGQRDHRIDAKDRVVIPSAYAAEITTNGRGIVHLTPGPSGKCLRAYPDDVFREMASSMRPDPFEEDPRKARFFGHAEACDLTGPGRTTIPERFRVLFPKGEVRVVGVNTYLELWDPELWDATYGSGISPNGIPSPSPR